MSSIVVDLFVSADGRAIYAIVTSFYVTAKHPLRVEGRSVFTIHFKSTVFGLLLL